MERVAAIFLAHLNPLTNTHVNIISRLKKTYSKVYVFPVRFLKDGKEINTKSFPFSYDIRKAMIESAFKSSTKVSVLHNYTFYSPFIKYFPPFISPYSWILRNEIVRNVSEEKFVSYTGDKIERIALRAYFLHPIRSSRLDVSATSIKELIYSQAIYDKYSPGKEYDERLWHNKIPEGVVGLIKENWKIIKRFASSPDLTIKFMGMKFPKEGFI